MNSRMLKKIKTAIVFGGASHDGKCICEKLVKEKFYTFCVDDLSGSSSINPQCWDNDLPSNPRFIFFEEKWEKFVASEDCIEAHIDVVVFLIKTDVEKKEKCLCEWLNTLDIRPEKIIINNRPSILNHPIWEFILAEPSVKNIDIF